MTAQHIELSYKRFNPIEVYFSAVHVYFINCFNAKLYRETLLVLAPTVRFTAPAVMMRPTCYSDTIFNFCPFLYHAMFSGIPSTFG